MWHAAERQATDDQADRSYQDGVDLCAVSNMAIGFPLFRNWKLCEGLELGSER